MKRYTLGFLFDPSFDHVLLIRKTRPEWQVGKHNGIGGKLEENETIHEGIAREMREESGIDTLPREWVEIGEMGNEEWRVAILACSYPGEKSLARSLTDETVAWFPVDKMPETIIPNLTWIVPLCQDVLLGRQITRAKIEYRK